MSTNIYINSCSINFVKVGFVTQNCSVCEGNGPKSKHTIPPISGTLSGELSVSGNDAFNESSGDLMSKKGYFADCKEFSNQKLQNDHQVEEELPVPKKSSPFKVVAWNFDQRLKSKDVCVDCNSTYLEPMDEQIFCFKCGVAQDPPFSIFKPSILTLSGKVIILDDDGPYLVPMGICRFCRRAALERVSNELVCQVCEQSQFQNPVPGDQVIFKLLSGNLLKLKGDDSDQSSNKDMLIIEANVDNRKYLLCEDCGSPLENGTPVPTF